MFTRLLISSIFIVLVSIMLGCNTNGKDPADSNDQTIAPPAPDEPVVEKRIALVIANADYTGEINPLRNPLNDADSVASTLKALNFSVTKLTNLKREQMGKAIQNFTKSINQKNVVSLFYYAGHGFEKDGKNYLVPIDATDPEDVKFTGYDLSLFTDEIRGVENLINLVFLDACREELSRGIDGRGSGGGRGFGDLNATGNLFIGYATAKGDVAADATGNQGNSPFTKAFISNMRIRGSDIDAIFKQIVTQTMELSPNRQRPYSYNSTTYTFVPIPGERNIRPPTSSNKNNCDELIDEAGKLFTNAEYGEAKSKYAEAMRKCPEKTYLAEYITICERNLRNPTPSPADAPTVPVPSSEATTKPAKEESVPSPKSETKTKPAQKETVPPNGSDPFSKNMVYVEGGTFRMGCTQEQGGVCDDDEKPPHEVRLNSFYISRYEVTQAEWRSIMGANPSYNTGCDNCPVEKVSWKMIQDFLSKLNARTGQTYELPTEAEWEYAARGGGKSRGYKYSGSNNLDDVAWYDGNYKESKHGSEGTTHPIGKKDANELGLYDMSGNVWEWCADRYGSYSAGTSANPKGPATGNTRVVRGGSWGGNDWYCRVSNRYDYNPDNDYNVVIGVRVVRRL
ncbi:MAG: SUMF1/EgtB/PvdO family nonheme iron enzyme [Sphingobacteriales bacterium]|nr:MAG: SUMF1/EgtB/PvdO family nonheme iron enzyme [Sphingobacteriales bacterium]